MDRTVAIVGGTGAEGFGLALRWTRAGLAIRLGSRDAERAASAAARVREQVAGADVTGLPNGEAVRGTALIVVTVPFAAQIGTLKSIRGELGRGVVVVDATVPVGAAIGDRVAHVITPWAGSAAQQAAAQLPDQVVVSAFHTLSAAALADLDAAIECDALVCGDSTEARARVLWLAERIPGVHGVDAGALENSRLAESAAALLIALNIRHNVRASGLRITGLAVGR